MVKQFLKNSFGWGFLLWLVGYGLRIVFFSLVPPHLIGWTITPIGSISTLYVLIKHLNSNRNCNTRILLS